jgi:hypothetical protein
MAKRKTNPTSWSNCKSVIQNWPMAGLRELVHELYDLSEENRRFLHGRLLPAAGEQTLDDAVRAVSRIVSVQAVFNGRFRHVDAGRVVDQFAKAVDDVLVARLLLADLSCSCATLSEVGDFEQMVDHMYASTARLAKLMEKLEPAALPDLVEGLNDLAKAYGSSFGYGISDEIVGLAMWSRERLGGQGENASE